MQVQYPITFLYYNDLESATRFYGEVLGLNLWRDQGFCKIFHVGEAAYVGLVDGEKGSLRPTAEKGVLLTFVVDDVKRWHTYLESQKVDDLTPIHVNEDIGVTGFFFKDPEGYTLEIQVFLS